MGDGFQLLVGGCLADSSGELEGEKKDVPKAREEQKVRSEGCSALWKAERPVAVGGQGVPGSRASRTGGTLWLGSPGMAVGADELDQVWEHKLRAFQVDA